MTLEKYLNNRATEESVFGLKLQTNQKSIKEKLALNYENVDEIMLLQASGKLEALVVSCDPAVQRAPWSPHS